MTFENSQGQAQVALSLAALFLQEQNPEEAEAYAATAHAFFSQGEDPATRVRTGLLSGDIQWARKQPQKALPFYEEALELCRHHEDTLGTATLLDRIATQKRLLGDEKNAFAHFREAAGLWEKLDIPDRLALTFTHLADICHRRGDTSQAAGLYEEALALYRRTHNERAVELVEKQLESLKGE